MAEMKRNFAKARMNKDADERVLPAGEYRDALNVQVTTSDTGDAGALQNIKGNLRLRYGEAGTHVDHEGTCVGMVANASTDKIYYFVTKDETGEPKTDYIVECDTTTSNLAYVFVDIWESSVITSSAGSSATKQFAGDYRRSIRPGMVIKSTDAGDVRYHEVVSVTEGAGAVTTVVFNAALTTTVNQLLRFEHPSVLGFRHVNGLITGVNILDDTIFWTDNVGEPKRINITKSKAGTGGNYLNSTGEGLHTGLNADYHTRFVRTIPKTPSALEIVRDASNHVQNVKEEDITVIRKSPNIAMRVKTSDTIDDRSGTTSGTINSAVIWSGSHGVGDEISGLSFASLIYLEVDDIVTFTAMNGGDGGYDIKARVTVVGNPGAGTTVGHKFEVMTISSDLFGGYNEWQVRLVVGEALLDNKFARFSYRYKYDDGEYSTFAPWSRIAFAPGLYNWNSSVGYNEGMANNTRLLELSNFLPSNRPLGVVEVDLLYKETSNPTVYTLKTMLGARLSDVGDVVNSLTLKSDLVHAVVESNQLLRAWDNVPRKALAQEVSANRIIYGNYLQSYNVPSNPEVDFYITSKDLAYGGSGVASSVKTLRSYQIGVVFGDKYGRETPVLPSSIDNSFTLPVTASSFSNCITASLNTPPPDWATHYSFYIKEPSVEYYTLAMDRWYPASDGDVWISFPSTERNKIDESTFLYLKKAHGSDIPVLTAKKYKVLSISSGAPESVKMVYDVLGRVQNTEADNDQIGNANIGYPNPGQRIISISKNQSESSVEFGDLNQAANHRIRFAEGNAENFSSFYDIDRVSSDESRWYFHLRGPLGPDVAFSSSDGTWVGRIDDLTLIVYEGTPVNKPEFEGRFFVKISKDPDVENLITSFQGDDWLVFHEQEIAYLNNDAYVGRLNSEPILRQASDFDASISGIGAHPIEYSHLDSPVYNWTNDSVSIANTTSESRNSINSLNGDNESTREFWEGMAGRFFIDRCSAYSWSGRVGAVPGSTYDTGNYNDQYWWANDAGYSTSGQFGLESVWGLRYGELQDDTPNAQNHQFSLKPGGFWHKNIFDPFVGWTSSAFTHSSGSFANLFLTALTNANDKTASLPAGVNNNPGQSNNGGEIADRGTEFAAAYGSTALDTGGALPSRGIWNGDPWGYMDLSFTGFSDNPMIPEISGYPGYIQPGTIGVGSSGLNFGNTYNQLCKISDDPDYIEEAEFIERLYKPGAKFRFKNDPDSVVYNVKDYPRLTRGNNHSDTPRHYFHPDMGIEGSLLNPWEASIGEYADGFHKHGHFGIRNYKTSDPAGQFEGSNLRQRWTLKVKPMFGSGPSGYRPDRGTSNEDFTIAQQRALHHDGSNVDAIQVLTPATIDDDGNDISGGFVTNPAVWETRPAESADVDLYFQASDIIPLRVDNDTSQDFFPDGSTASISIGGINYSFVISSVTTTPGSSASDGMITKLNLTQTSGINVSASGFNNYWLIGTPNGRRFSVQASAASGDSFLVLASPENLPNTAQELTWSNCWAFGNGVESDRVRDDFNAPQVDNGVKASTVLGEKVQEERRAHGVIWSGIYNSNSGVNNTNQFIAAQKITKDLNPVYGSLQALLNRDTRLIMFCEDKVLRAVTNKDALYNADGNPQLVSSNSVVGDVVPYLGDFGISKNPESLAVAPVSAYFADASRGRVLALSGEGIRPISAYGMEGYFSDLKNIANSNSIIGSFDSNTKEYNLSYTDTTVSYSERSKSWVSFKSFIPEAGISLNNNYYTFAKKYLWKHHHNPVGDLYNNFYNSQFNSEVTVVLGDTNGGVKSFSTVSYEGSKAKVTPFVSSNQSIPTGDFSVNLGLDTNETTTDGEYSNLVSVDGWYMDSMETNLQKTGVTEFTDKEGKWFGVPKGLVSYDTSGETFKDIDAAEVSTQGLGVASSATYAGTATGNVTLTVKNSSSSQSGELWD